MSGGSLIFVVYGALGLVILIFIVFQGSLILGGSREIRNSVDAAVLNMAKQSVSVRVPTDVVYKDIGDTHHMVGLSNVSRLLGKSFLINANEQEMKDIGQDTFGGGETDARKAYEDAMGISSQLSMSLKSRSRMDVFFNQFAKISPVRLLGGNTKVSPDSNNLLATAMVDAGSQSNLSWSPTQLPKNVSLPGVSASGSLYVVGYKPVKVNQHEYFWPAFPNNVEPHLISDTTFQASPGSGTKSINAVPNAFSESGFEDANTSLSASACAVANPQRQYKLAIPFGFIGIKFSNKARWYLQGKKITETVYGSEVETQCGLDHVKLPGGGFLDGYASLGNEYSAKKAPNLWGLYNEIPGGCHQGLELLVQRLCEIQPSFTIDDLQKLMKSQSLRGPKSPENSFIVLPNYKSPDNTDPDMRIFDISSSKVPGWYKEPGPTPEKIPEGNLKQILQSGQIKDAPNYCWETVTGASGGTGEHWTMFSALVSWKPGTGYTQNLGELHIEFITDCYFNP